MVMEEATKGLENLEILRNDGTLRDLPGRPATSCNRAQHQRTLPATRTDLMAARPHRADVLERPVKPLPQGIAPQGRPIGEQRQRQPD